MSTRKDVVIVGAGVLGCSTAYHLGKKGVASLVIERESIGARASGKSWAVIPYPPAMYLLEHIPDKFYSMPVDDTGGMAPFLELFTDTYYRLEDIHGDLKQIGGIDFDYGEMTYVNVALDEEEVGFYRQALEILRSLGHHGCDYLSRDDLTREYPDLNPAVLGGMAMPMLQLEPYRYTLGYAQAAEKMGAEFRQGDVVGFGTKGDRITSVRLASGAEIEADTVVITAGPWLTQCAGYLGRDIPTTVSQEQCIRLEFPGTFSKMTLSAPKVAVVPKINGDIIIGVSGDKSLASNMRYVPDEEEFDHFMELAIDLVPSLDKARIVEKRGDLECWNAGPAYAKPILGPMPGYRNGYVAGAVGTLGQSMSAGVGRNMADLVTGAVLDHSAAKRMIEYLSPR
ncbi:MAG: FAD-binding oxidoreductase [Gammaproteobacteria bacterium]|jgi:glycine/D-amino acid oxidase-like deaminating enzyme|nr:FAD-binding oxidoreductase [Gammaproteobacteria bacterium]